MGAELKVAIVGDGSGLSQAFASAKVQAGEFANSIRTSIVGSISSQMAGLLSVGAVTGLSAKTIEFAGHMRDLADTLKVNVEWLQKMRNAAKATGATEDDLGKIMMRIQQSRQSAFANPEGPQGSAFKRLGFSAGEISGPNSLNPQAFVEKLMKSLAAGANENDVAIVGSRAAFKMLNAFRQGIDDNSSVITEDVIDALDAIGDEFEILKTQLMVDIAPAIVFVSESLRGFKYWIDKVTAAAAGASVGTEKLGEKSGRAFSKSGGGIKGIASAAVAILKNGSDDVVGGAGQAIITEEERQDERDAEIRARLAAERASRRKREKKGPDFDQEIRKESRFKIEKVSTDALSKSGLFTVSGLLAKPELRIEQEQLNALNKIVDNTANAANPFQE